MMSANRHSSSNTQRDSRGAGSHQHERFKFRILVPLIIAVALLLSAFIFAFHQEQRQRSVADINRAAAEIQKLLRVEQEEKAALMATTLQTILNDGEMGELFARADREGLLRRATPLCAEFGRNHKVTHFYFHDTNRVNLLRVHRPEQFGDIVNRYTLKEAERTGQMTSGIERGPIGTFVLRVVSPWRHDGKLLGYAELGMEFEDIVKMIHGLFDADFVAAVDKKFLDREQWDKGLKTYGRKASWHQFPNTVVMDKTVDTIPEPVANYLRSSGREAKNHVVEWKGRVSQIVFLPLNDVSGKTLGQLIVLRDITNTVQQARTSMMAITLLCLAVSAVLVVLFYFFLSRVESDFTAGNARLKAEILERQRAEESLREARNELERRVEERTRELESVHRRLMDVSRLSGMAEVATGVLHNVGNVLNSVNVSTTLIREQIRKSKLIGLRKAVALIPAHVCEAAEFFTNDPRGKQLPEYLGKLSDRLGHEQEMIFKEVSLLAKHVEHIKEIVAVQQAYAKISGVNEALPPVDLIEDALRMNDAALVRHDVTVVREFEAVPHVVVDRHKVLQILINLISNAKYALDCRAAGEKILRLRVEGNGGGHVKISVIDNGTGISRENLSRVFEHGFTTRKDGHGFGLHSSANAARELGGSLVARSDGDGLGATFILELPTNLDLCKN